MSSEDLTPISDLDAHLSTPAPDLDDHRHKRPRPGSRMSRSPGHLSPNILPKQSVTVPSLELQQATPHDSLADNFNLLRVDEALRQSRAERNERLLRTRDFEHAVTDDSGDEAVDNLFRRQVRGSGRRLSAYRDSRRSRRLVNPAERSRDTSSHRSSSPANSVEAFAEPRRRIRANTADSHLSLADFRPRDSSFPEAGTRRPTVSAFSIPPTIPSANRAVTDNEDEDELGFSDEEEAGKTYRIDFEELDEFVALCCKDTAPSSSQPSTLVPSDSLLFSAQRQNEKYGMNNAALNPETFYVRPVTSTDSSTSQIATNEKSGPKNSSPKLPPCQDRFTFFSSELQTHICGSTLADLVAHGDTFRDLFDVGPVGGVWWLNILNPTKAELEVITKAFRIHRLTKEDIETQEAREKVELFTNYYFVCFKTFNSDKDSEDFLAPLHVYIVVTADGVLSFSYTSNPHAQNVRGRIAKVGDFVSLSADYICYALIDDIVDCIAPVIREAEHKSESIEDQVFTAREEDFPLLLREIAQCRKRVLNMMRLLGGKADVIKGFAKRCNDEFSVAPRGDIGLYLGDIQDHVVTMMSNLSHVERILSRSHSTYLAQLNVEHMLKGNSTNSALAKLTVVATIIVPLNLVTGLFGMNVHVPGQNDSGSYSWFLGIVGLLITFVLCALTVARRFKYI